MRIPGFFLVGFNLKLLSKNQQIRKNYLIYL